MMILSWLLNRLAGLFKRGDGMKTNKTIVANLRKLRKAIDASDDIIFQRIAYEIETAVRWAREGTVGWCGLLQQALDVTELIKSEINREKR